MRKLIIVALLTVLSLSLLGQTPNLNPTQADSARNAAFKQLGGIASSPVVDVSVADELAYMRLCMDKYNRQWGAGFGMQVVGSVLGGIAIAAVYPNNPKGGRGLIIASGGLFTLGFVFQLSARSHLSKFAVGLGGQGVQVRYTF